MPARVVFLLFAGLHGRALPRVVCLRLLVDPDSIPAEDSSLLRLLTLELSSIISVSLRLDIVQGRREVDINIGINDANCVVLILRGDLQYINLKLVIEDLYADGVSLMQTGKVPELVLQDGLGVLHVDELGLVRL